MFYILYISWGHGVFIVYPLGAWGVHSTPLGPWVVQPVKSLNIVLFLSGHHFFTIFLLFSAVFDCFGRFGRFPDVLEGLRTFWNVFERLHNCWKVFEPFRRCLHLLVTVRRCSNVFVIIRRLQEVPRTLLFLVGCRRCLEHV